MEKQRKTRTKRTIDPSFSALPRMAYSIKEAACMLGVSPSTVLQWIHEHKLRAIQKGDGQSRRHFTIPLSALQEFIAAGSSSERL